MSHDNSNKRRIIGMHKNFIGGAWVEGTGTNHNVNPANPEEIIGDYTQGDRDQAFAAISSARDAFPAWSRSTPQQRFDILDRIGSEILARKEELGRLLTREEGKTLAEGIGEANRAGAVFKFFAGEALRLGGEQIASVRPDITVDVTREPVGVVGLITPWNFPIAIPAWKIAPALAYGNCVVIKPADITPGCVWALTKIISRSGLPDGVFNLVMGPGSVVGQAFAESHDVDAISFTGSTGVGTRLRRTVTDRGGRIQLEMGGKNPLVILDDADLDTAVECAVNGAFFSTGQRCTASSRLIVTEGIHDRFVDALLERMKGLRIGDGLDPATDIGPVVSREQKEQILEYVRIGEAEGARLLLGGAPGSAPSAGHYVTPTLFVDTHPTMRINREEIFGPVASVIKVKDFEQALDVANAVEFGLSAGICTRSLSAASDFKRRVQAGMVMVNLPTAGVDYHVAFGGRKASSYGPREQGSYAREFYTVMKTAYTLPI
ncbi:aldehyde dehydrogenase family protein [Halomonas kalidii]|uniref:aldehyde dehydrogenase (NAD(+)) n=1 Tax=Halomonas kalidii TaxID=3043293 RepID=A0ABT6VQR7_9GAMM|nr:aldehyde dehydrogenase family protein [Halomonas kalidii]MDI5936327.1 aldehyde dehydrogenase family protein [Halomonas kalidii]